MEKFDIKEIALIGRTGEEYEKMFRLSDFDLKNEEILDAGGGVSSFTAESGADKVCCVSADRFYNIHPDKIKQKAGQDLELVINTLDGCEDRYTWGFYGDKQGLKRHREKAYLAFIEDYRKYGWKRYIKTDFPVSPFMDNEFSLTLVSHFLFLYDEHMDYEFHRNTVEELIRITRNEIRVFPLMNLRWKKSGFVGRIMKDVIFKRCRFSVEKSELEFIKGGDEFLKIEIS